MKGKFFTCAALLSLFGVSGCERAYTPGEVGDDVDRQTSAEADRTVGETVDDAALTGKVKTALTTDPLTEALQINVTTYNGSVQLSGFVDSADEKQRAEELARSVSGVREVRNELEVKEGS